MSNLIREAVERLQAQGGRLTGQRRLILETLESMSGHPTAEELFDLARHRSPNLHLSTVYRTLRWLESEGLVSSRMFAEERRQERFDPAYPSEHHHFVCTSCKQVIEFYNPLLDTVNIQFKAQFGAQVESCALVLYGLCAECRQAIEDNGK